MGQPHLQLITKRKKRMKEWLLLFFDKLMLRKRGIVESITDQLKNISQIEHTRHRSVYNFFVNLSAGLVTYTFREKKPSLHSTQPPFDSGVFVSSYIELTSYDKGRLVSFSQVPISKSQ